MVNRHYSDFTNFNINIKFKQFFRFYVFQIINLNTKKWYGVEEFFYEIFFLKNVIWTLFSFILIDN